MLLGKQPYATQNPAQQSTACLSCEKAPNMAFIRRQVNNVL